MKKKTMHESYGEPNDKLGKHLVCESCGFCMTCKDCIKYGCGKGYKNPKTHKV